MLFGILHLGFWGDLIALLIMTHITGLGISVYLHRCESHRALDMHPVLKHFFRFWLWLTTGMGTKDFVAVHRLHHARSDKEGDPHSPHVFGLRTVLWRGAELFIVARKDKAMVERYGKGAPDDWLERHIYKHDNLGRLGLLLPINIILFGLPGISIWAIQMIWSPFWAAGVINGIGHWLGYRNFECPDQARNIMPWGLIMLGEELHNNHHTYGTSAKFSVKWWEFDLGWFYITLFRALGLVKVKATSPKLTYDENKKHIDVDTLKAVIRNRFHLMADYSRKVLLPVCHQEARVLKGYGLYVKAKRLLTQEPSLLSQQMHQHVDHILEKVEKLRLTYDYRMKLQAIWEKTTATQKELVEALQEWCQQAEAAGIEVLREYAKSLRRCCVAAS